MNFTRSDVDAIVSIMSEVSNLSVAKPLHERRNHLLQQLSLLVEADIWTHVTGIINPDVPGDAMSYSIHDGGFRDEKERASFYRLILHPDLAKIQIPIAEAVAQNRSIAVRRCDLVSDEKWSEQPFSQLWHTEGFDDLILAVVPIENGHSALGLHRRKGGPRFDLRHLELADAMFAGVGWLHREIGNPVAANAALRLSPRERQVLVLLLDGASRTEIASALAISVHTVIDYISEIYKKIGVNSHKQLLAYFAKRV